MMVKKKRDKKHDDDVDMILSHCGKRCFSKLEAKVLGEGSGKSTITEF